MKTPNLIDGLKHIETSLRPEKIDMCLESYTRLRKEGKGKEDSPLLFLHSLYSAKTLYSWFHDGDLQQAKKYAYIAGRLRVIYSRYNPLRVGDCADSYLFYPLLSDSRELIHWEKQYFVPLVGDNRKNPSYLNVNSYDFRSLQFRLALAGSWDLLVPRAEKFLGEPHRKFKSYTVENEFYLALASQDEEAMRNVFLTLTSPRYMQMRNREPQWGYEKRLVAAHSFMLIKLARIHGFDIAVDTPWIPNEWLLEKPLKNYIFPIDCLQEFNIFDKFDSRNSCLDLPKLTPRPLGEPPLTFAEAVRLSRNESG
ncbi:hypothetical protein Maes01_02764 [Microbulbifer aestuariivivens]|uniref:Uncharacterized protein n=1 Tax=Microbulbifer aestuariivivens TaxID=1908308 RepID=A0ABP9WSR5_9GAMM